MTAPASPGLEIDPLLLKKAALVFRALNHKLRQQILRLLDKEERITVTGIYVKMKLEQSVCSQHLAILRKADLVFADRHGKQIFYTVNYQKIKQLHSMAADLLQNKA